jgi:hypothetical protein
MGGDKNDKKNPAGAGDSNEGLTNWYEREELHSSRLFLHYE